MANREMCVTVGRLAVLIIVLFLGSGCSVAIDAYSAVKRKIEKNEEEETNKKTIERLALVDGFVLNFSGNDKIDGSTRDRITAVLTGLGLKERKVADPKTVKIDFKSTARNVSYRSLERNGVYGAQNRAEKMRAENAARYSRGPVGYKQWYRVGTAVQEKTTVTMLFADGHKQDWTIDSNWSKTIIRDFCAEMIRHAAVDRSVAFVTGLNDELTTDCLKGLDSERDKPFYVALAARSGLSQYVQDGVIAQGDRMPDLGVEPIVRRNYSSWLNRGPKQVERATLRLPGIFAYHYYRANKEQPVALTEDNIVFYLYRTFNAYAEKELSSNIAEPDKRNFDKRMENYQYNWNGIYAFLNLYRENNPALTGPWLTKTEQLATRLVSRLVREKRFKAILPRTVTNFAVDRNDLKLIANDDTNYQTQFVAKRKLNGK